MAGFPVVDQGPERVAEEDREGPRPLVVTFEWLYDLQLLGQVGATAEGHAGEARELREARVCAQGHDALGGRERATVQLPLLSQLSKLPFLLLLEEPPLRQVVLPAQGESPKCCLQVVGARCAWRAWLLMVLLIPAEDRG